MSVPISLIIDDPAPLINVYWWHAAESQATENPVLGSSEPVARDVPVDFLRRFADVVDRFGIGGKFSVLPIPAGLGKITEGWQGCDGHQLQTWLDIVRQRIMPRMDITPEILTHARTVDLETGSLLPENERNWSFQQTAGTMTPYIVQALELLNDVGLEANGVTSPWDFGSKVEAEYQEAIAAAMLAVNGRRQTWYFLHAHDRSTRFLSQVVRRQGDGWLVSIWSQVDDYLWQTMDTQQTGVSYVGRVADNYLSEDGREGRLAELFAAGTPMVLCTHWQSLFANGRETGLQALAEVCRRVQATWGEDVEWLRCSELADRVAKQKSTVAPAEPPLPPAPHRMLS